MGSYSSCSAYICLPYLRVVQGSLDICLPLHGRGCRDRCLPLPHIAPHYHTAPPRAPPHHTTLRRPLPLQFPSSLVYLPASFTRDRCTYMVEFTSSTHWIAFPFPARRLNFLPAAHYRFGYFPIALPSFMAFCLPTGAASTLPLHYTLTLPILPLLVTPAHYAFRVGPATCPRTIPARWTAGLFALG